MNTYEANFNKNLGALESYNAILADKIEDVKTNERFEVFAGKNTFDTNIYDHKLKQSLYDNPEKFFDEKYNEIYTKYERYPVLFFYGLGNGLLYKALLQNENHKSIVVFEPNIEILYIVFHLIDFSQELKDKRLYVVDTNDFDLSSILAYLSGTLGLRSYLYDSKIFNHCDYYKIFQDDMNKIDHDLEQILNFLYNALGFDAERFIYTLYKQIITFPIMLTKPSLTSLLIQRKFENENVVIVSSGPSLTKQLSLLKEYSNKTSIICVDGSYPILAKHDIKPDYVVCLEQNDLSSEFFNNDFKDFDKDIIFIISILTHPKTLTYLEKNNRKVIIAPKNNTLYGNFLEKNHFETLGGLNVSSMACEFALKLGYKNIILIGQDLAYGKDFSSHSKEFSHGDDLDTGYYKNTIQTKAYGGQGSVYTHEAWMAYKQGIEIFIKEANLKNISVFNATEGGARIEGSIEKPFKEICNHLFMQKKYFNASILTPITEIEQNSIKKDLFECLKTLTDAISIKNNVYKNKLNPILKNITKIQIDTNIEKINFSEILNINTKIHQVKEELENEKILVLNETLINALALQEVSLAKISMMSAHTQKDKKTKMLLWVYMHKEWINTILKTLDSLQNNLEKALNILKESS
ncbi:DUF115 domain-containing protein [Campylobacter lari]|nr:DUF115 domain-containing protein [Campylobacter lari]